MNTILLWQFLEGAYRYKPTLVETGKKWYGNEEEVWIGDLLASQGKHARAQQELAAQGYFADNIDVELYVQGSSPAWQYAEQLHGPSTSFIPDIPPLPPFPLDDDGVTDDKALASMLMSWYMSGYHTSNYQGEL
ncbi:survival motor neuron protein-like isoform X3 [Tachypleus tridentatus]|uniref:survival motor neuron protein-like isoform X3 n=1 Tax=Tachypleus tridentatus TaxID=6853 RepID=UPI003FD38FF4